jgi:hypothetical protein
MAILEGFQSRTQIKPLAMGQRHPEVGVYMDKSSFY